jgi:hypothetical protein
VDLIATPTALNMANTSPLTPGQVEPVSYVSGLVKTVAERPETDSGSTGTTRRVGTGTTDATSVDLFGLGGLKGNRVWRPVKFTRNQDYPKVILDGCKFKQDSGGFALFQRTPAKYLGHYRRDTITELEKKHGAKKPRKRKDRT